MKEQFDLDSFGELMNRAIHESAIGLAVTKEANSDEWTMRGTESSVVNFYLFLNMFPGIYDQMLREIERVGGYAMKEEELLDRILDMIREDAKERIRQRKGRLQ